MAGQGDHATEEAAVRSSSAAVALLHAGGILKRWVLGNALHAK